MQGESRSTVATVLVVPPPSRVGRRAPGLPGGAAARRGVEDGGPLAHAGGAGAMRGLAVGAPPDGVRGWQGCDTRPPARAGRLVGWCCGPARHRGRRAAGGRVPLRGCRPRADPTMRPRGARDCLGRATMRQRGGSTWGHDSVSATQGVSATPPQDTGGVALTPDSSAFLQTPSRPLAPLSHSPYTRSRRNSVP